MAKLIYICPKCNSTKMKNYNTYKYEGKSMPRYKCHSCGYLTIYPLMKMRAERKKKVCN